MSGCRGVGAPFTGVSSHKTVYFPLFTSILQWEAHNNIIHSMPGDEFFSYHTTNLCTLGSAQESKEFSNGMSKVYPHESAGFKFHALCHYHLKFG